VFAFPVTEYIISLCGQVSDLISKIQEAYVETLEELSWMDDQSKEKAREKVQTYNVQLAAK
jgi:predicted metalloendopeptidase